ncbi:SMP-30/gluconolactonase/LRE family protein [Rubrivirga sp.]|uniref:SMP-30/gluconolactonase/LRE family protein n=1 Tax=Rubrivirga sp. TaxID=1885344 RepID=UPI003B52D965
MLRPLVLAAVTLSACATAQPAGDPAAFRALVPADAAAEVLAEGFAWSEGPVWRPAEGDLLFTDVPGNTVWRWAEGDGLSVFLRPSGLAVGPGRDASVGSNGLILDADGRLLLADHGSRAVTRLDPATYVREVLADRYDGRRFNSPNDLVLHASGALFFTDPPYGLAGQDASPQKEQPHNGVYRLDPDGTVMLLIDDLTRPNGVVLSPDGRTLTVANSDPERAIWMRYPVLDGGALGPGRLLFDATEWVAEGRPGLPDGMAVDADGTLFATGPGGVLVFSAAGDYLGTLETEKATANVTFGGPDGRMLFLTSSDRLLRIPVATRGLGL